MQNRFLPALSLFILMPAARVCAGGPAQYVGAQVCAQCHAARVAQQAASNHARTWSPRQALDRLAGLPQKISEGKVSHSIEKVEGRWSYLLQLSDRPAQVIPIHSVVGGERFGISFILEVEQIQGQRLARPALVEGRFMLEAGSNRLKLSPGFPTVEPYNYELAVGRVLTPQFAEKCLDCHAGPVDSGLAEAGQVDPPLPETGVRCERCHGPGSEHVRAVAEKDSDLKIIHPGRLSVPGQMKLCGQCHSGFRPLVRPRPDDVLIASQVIALTSSECYVQSRAGLSCINCHNPHENAQASDRRYQAVCLSCHRAGQDQGAICPVNPEAGCISCHMPVNVQHGSFHLTDHWIRVHAGSGSH